MDQLQTIYDAIAAEGFSAGVLAMIDKYANDILYGTASISRFNLSEHAGVCTAGAVLIGASVVAGYARASLEASANAAAGQGGSPSNWQIDERQEKTIEQWAKAAGLWVQDSDVILLRTFGPMIAQGAEAKGFRDNWYGQGVNYTSDRIALEDMHPANVFIDEVTDKPICIDCIVKFV